MIRLQRCKNTNTYQLRMVQDCDGAGNDDGVDERE